MKSKTYKHIPLYTPFMTIPSSFCSICTEPTAFELVGLLLSLSIYHPHAPVIIVSDAKTKYLIESISPPPRLNISWHIQLDKYSGLNRAQMEAKSIFTEFLMFKAVAMELALESYSDTLFLDSDIIVTDVIDSIDNSKDLGLSPHYMTKHATDNYGFYNSGMVWTKSKQVPTDWKLYNQTSRFFEQASLEDLARKYSHFTFGEHYNIQGWRMYHNPEGREALATYFSVNPVTKKVCYKNAPMKCIHTHVRDKTFEYFNNLIVKNLQSAKAYKELAILFRVMYGKWLLRIPKQPMPGHAHHNNDSYRELATVIEKHYSDVQVHEDINTIHCWLAPTISLYDRDTLDWINDELNQATVLLLGNGDIKTDGPKIRQKFPDMEVHPWIYWPRFPTVLEEFLDKKGRLKYDERAVETTFIGNYENAVQQKYRTNCDWASVIEEFHCTGGTKHKFTHLEYLEKMAKAKFGLCLRGYGSKCHREVELMSLGTVPIITPEVCIDSFLHPPQEGVHYIRINHPGELKEKLKKISKEEWEKMSEACMEWYQTNAHSKNAWLLTIQTILYGKETETVHEDKPITVTIQLNPVSKQSSVPLPAPAPVPNIKFNHENKTYKEHMNLQESNEFMIDKIKANKPFIISRLGIGQETIVSYLVSTNNPIHPNNINILHNNAGIYCNTKEEIVEYSIKFNACLEHSSALAEWGGQTLYPYEQYFIQTHRLKCLTFKVLEPFYCIEENLTPWSHSLLGKKVLVINPFTESMQQQLNNGFQIYKNKRLFLEGQEFVFYKSYNTSGMNRLHSNWIETFELMCKDISKLDFDIALLGCGGYGLPLCDFIFTKMNKSAVYIGGGIQLLFGVMGNRWANDPMWKRIIAENDSKFIHPNANEQLKNQNNIEGSCYW